MVNSDDGADSREIDNYHNTYRQMIVKISKEGRDEIETLHEILMWKNKEMTETEPSKKKPGRPQQIPKEKFNNMKINDFFKK